MNGLDNSKIHQAACTPISAIASTARPEPEHEALIYCGRHPDGRFRLKIHGQKYLVNGAIYALSKGTDHKGNPLWLKLLLDMTPGYRVAKADELSFDVFCETTGARMAIMGQANACAKPSTQVGGAHG